MKCFDLSKIFIIQFLLFEIIELKSSEHVSSNQHRTKRNFDVDDLPDICEFGSIVDLTTCEWRTPEEETGVSVWRSALGQSSNWIGGPRIDHTTSDNSGGYVFYETSQLARIPEGERRRDRSSAMLYSPMFNHSGPSGICLNFFFNIDGPSAKSLRVLLKDSLNTITVLWESVDGNDGRWHLGEVAYSYGQRHQIIFEAVAADHSQRRMAYRGHVAVDDVKFDTMPAKDVCIGHCTFEGGFCGWENMEEDDFDMELGRGSNTFLTGPPRDYSSTGKDEGTGGFAFIDTSFPRRPGDTAMLSSPTFYATGDNNPLCMHFATHMYGNGVGTLRLVIRNQGDSDRIVWEMNGPSGNRWYKAQVTLSSASPFQLLLIVIVGNKFGNIAIDDFSFRLGSCPVVPQTAAKDSGDCSFEENMCGWSNSAPQDQLDDIDWARQYHYDLSGPSTDHTRGDNKGYYMNLVSNAPLILRGGTRAWFISPKFKVSANTRCISFYYWMFERLIDPAGLSLGSLRVYVRLDKPGKPLSPLWRLYNHQGENWYPARSPIVISSERAPPQVPYEIIFEGIWGEGRVGNIAIDDITFFDGDCTPIPFGSSSVIGECFFERDTCGWTFISMFDEVSTVAPTSEPKTTNSIEETEWILSSLENKPSGLLDHTFRSATGFVFFDVFNKKETQRPALRSPQLEADSGGMRCFAFWFVAFGRSESTALSVVLMDLPLTDDQKKTVIWRLKAKNFTNSTRTEWSYAQVNIEAKSDYILQFEGESSDGGFAVDDVTFYDGSCQTRPPAAVGKG